MKTFTAKETKNRLGAVIDAALVDGVVSITKNGKSRLVLMSVEKYNEMVQADTGFIDDAMMSEKNVHRIKFIEKVARGEAKASDASMFHGMAAGSKVRCRGDNI